MKKVWLGLSVACLLVGRFRDDRGRYLRHTVLGCGRPDGFYGCHDYVCAAVRRSGLLAAELTRRLSYGILFQKGKQNQPLPALRQ